MNSEIELIKKYTDTILLCFDKDLAGDTASRRGIEMADQAGLNIKVIQIFDGKDPAELALKDIKLWEKAVEEAEPIYDYYLKSVSGRYKITTAEGKRRIGEELLPIWSKITDSLTFEHYLQKLSALIGIPEEVLRKEIKKSKMENMYQPVSFKNIPEIKQVLKVRRDLLEEYLLSLL